MAKPSSKRPLAKARQAGNAKGGMGGPKAGVTATIPKGGPTYSTNLPSTQPGDRSHGIKRVKAYPQEKGL